MKLPILMYHEVNARKTFPELSKYINIKYINDVVYFEKQINYLYSCGYGSMTISELNNLPYHEVNKQVVLTFDDGYKGNYLYAFQILKALSFKATFFITTDWVNLPNMLTWEEIKEMSDYGMEIGSHTRSHALLGVENEANIRRELFESKEAIEQHISKTIVSVSYPNGSYSGLVNKIANEAGYKFACSSEAGYWESKKYKFVMPRMRVPNNLKDFRKIIELNPIILFSAFFQENLKKSLRIALGRKLYNRAYLKFFGLEEIK